MVSTRIYLSPPDVGQTEKDSLLAALASGWVAPAGPQIDQFEEILALASGRRSAVAVSSGTAALHLGLLGLGVRPGDYVLCATMTFVATANAIVYAGAKPYFVDSERNSGNMSAQLLEKAIGELRNSGRNIGAVVPVDFLGSMASYEEIVPLCQEFGIPILADAAESLGASRNGKPAGSYGSAAVFSFNGNKIATTSGGGALVTNDERMADKVRNLASQARVPARHYQHEELGFNYRLSNLLAAVGVAQLARLPEMIEARRHLRSRYRALISNHPGISVLGDADEQDNCWLTALVIDEKAAGFSAEHISLALEKENIESRPLWKPMHLQPLYSSAPSVVDGSSEYLYRTGIALPSGSGMSEAEWVRIQGVLGEFLTS